MRLIPSLIALLALVPCGIALAQESLSFKKVEIPRDEKRQQLLAGLIESRCAYDFSVKANQSIQLVAETYRDGKPVGLRLLSFGGGKNEAGRAQGIISVGWQRHQRELITINDEGFMFWSARAQIPAAEFDEPQFDWSIGADFYFAPSLPELRKGEYREPVALYPVLGISGERERQFRSDRIKTSADFIAACTEAQAKTAIVIYAYISSSSGGRPPLNFSPSSTR